MTPSVRSSADYCSVRPHRTGLGQAGKDVLVQALVRQAAVKALSTKPFGSACPARCSADRRRCALFTPASPELAISVPLSLKIVERRARLAEFRLARRQRVQGHSAPQEA